MSVKVSGSSLVVGDLKPMGNVHHAAYRCRDAEQTRWFYEDVLGLPLAAALVFDRIPGKDVAGDYMHLFFQLGDGNFLAFFDHPDSATNASFERKDSFDMHIALEVESHEAMLAWQTRINQLGKTCLGPVDHGFVQSVYMYDPNGIQVEITSKALQYDNILAEEAEQASRQMLAWSEKTRDQKVKKFGADAIDKRGQ